VIGYSAARLCVDFLPLSIVELDQKLHLSILFNFSMQYQRFVLIPADLTDWVDIEAEARRQWSVDAAAPALPEGSVLRLIITDFWGKFKAALVTGPVVLNRYETYVIDVVEPPPQPPADEPLMEPLLVNVQHVNRYSGETFFGRPTNMYLFPLSESETGEAVLQRALNKLGISDPTARSQCVRTWKVCLRLPTATKVLGRTELLKSLVPAEQPLPELSILLDHPQSAASSAKTSAREHAIHIRHSPIPTQ
jgi:hypothetical protein